MLSNSALLLHGTVSSERPLCFHDRPDPHVLLGCAEVLIAQRRLHSAAHIQLIIGPPQGELAALVNHFIHQCHVGVAGGCAGALLAARERCVTR